MKRQLQTLLLAWCACVATAARADDLDRGFANPPPQARLRAYWWWLNGNVNRAAITKDLEWMKAIGMGGALIFDAGGPAGPTPVGPTFGSPEWIKLLRHAAEEADRLGLELTLSPQSGWNLGGPCVSLEEATKHITWSELRITGPKKFSGPLPMPVQIDHFYRDTFVLAYRLKAEAAAVADPQISASSAQPGHAPEALLHGDGNTYWISNGRQAGKGPTPEQPEWVRLDLPQSLTVSGVQILPHGGHGPREGEWQISRDGKTFEKVQTFSVAPNRPITIRFAKQEMQCGRLLIRKAYDSSRPKTPRNVQIAEIALLDAEGRPIRPGRVGQPIRDLASKAMYHELGGSAPDCSPLLDDIPGTPGEEDVTARDVLDLTPQRAADGTLNWDVPPGTWQVLRFGYTNSGARVSTSTHGWGGRVVDYLDADALRSYWRQTIEPMLDAVGPLAGRSLKGFETDSWEAGGLNWTKNLPAEFQHRRGYELWRYLPVLTGRIVDSREVSNRFLADFRKTIGDCMADNHYGVMAELARARGMFIHCEASGPHAGPFDGLKNLGRCEWPMGEFWVQSRHRPTPESRFFMKCAACAAHIYGRPVACGEGFTSIGPHWEDVLWSSQKPTFDHEACAGLNLVYWHAFTCSPPEMGIPGQEYFAGTHFDPQITWAQQAHGFVGYLDRCQFLLQQGLFVADVCYYQGDHVPNIVARKQADPAGVLPGYDYDVFNEEVLLTRMSVGAPGTANSGRIVLPDGMSYRILVLPPLKYMSLAALEKIRDLVAAGATVVGPKPLQPASLVGYPECDARFKSLADELWDNGRVLAGKSAKQVLVDLNVAMDFEAPDAPTLDYIHRRAGDTDIYFVSNPDAEPQAAAGTFRVGGKQPELWDPVTAEIHPANAFRQAAGRTVVPLELPPYGSLFVVFRRPIAPTVAGTARSNFPPTAVVQELTGPWSVRFDPKWGGPAQPVTFDRLQDWTERPEPGIKYYSGTATYQQKFTLAAEKLKGPLFVDLGVVHEMAEVRLNGKPLGVVWCPPWRVDATAAVQAGENVLEIDVVNQWPNRLIGDAALPAEKRFTRTNVQKFQKDMPLVNSGLLGPVRLVF
jgi:hypothetical protein